MPETQERRASPGPTSSTTTDTTNHDEVETESTATPRSAPQKARHPFKDNAARFKVFDQITEAGLSNAAARVGYWLVMKGIRDDGKVRLSDLRIAEGANVPLMTARRARRDLRRTGFLRHTASTGNSNEDWFRSADERTEHMKALRQRFFDDAEKRRRDTEKIASRERDDAHQRWVNETVRIRKELDAIGTAGGVVRGHLDAWLDHQADIASDAEASTPGLELHPLRALLDGATPESVHAAVMDHFLDGQGST